MQLNQLYQLNQLNKLNKKEEDNYEQEKLEGDLRFTLSIFFSDNE